MASSLITFPRGKSLIDSVDNFWYTPVGKSSGKVFKTKANTSLDIIDIEKLKKRSGGYTVKELRNFMEIINSTHDEKIVDNGKVKLREQILLFLERQKEY